MACAVSGCYNPEWEVHKDRNSLGAVQYSAAQSAQECLDYCGGQSKCVGVDVDLTQQPPTCWPHFNTLHPDNVYSQPGTNQYRLKNRCVVAGWRFISIIVNYNCGSWMPIFTVIIDPHLCLLESRLRCAWSICSRLSDRDLVTVVSFYWSISLLLYVHNILVIDKLFYDSNVSTCVV